MTETKTTPTVAFPEHRVSLVEAFLRGLPSEATRQVYRLAIRRFRNHLGDRELADATRRDVEAYRSHLEELGRAPSTISKHLSALSGFFEFALDEGVVERNPAARARRPKVPDVSVRQGLSTDEVRALLAVPDLSRPVGLRDRALVLTLAVQGWRISELLGLRVEDLGEEAGHRTAEIQGKGGKHARVALAAEVWMAIRDWLASTRIEDGPVFVPVLKGGRVQVGQAISVQSAWRRIRFLARRAGIERKIHPHLFRHGAVTNALANGVALHLVQDFARHADPRTTRRYDSFRQSLANPTCHVLAGALAHEEDRGVEEPGEAGPEPSPDEDS